MALARFERDFTDEDGNLLTGNISVEVRRETGGLVPVYSDRDGASALGNPFVNSGGAVAFHCVGGAYKITVTQGGFERILRYVPVGTKQEQDQGTDFVGFSMQWETGTSAPPTAGCIRANNATLSSATEIYISETNIGGSSIAARLAELVAGDTIIVSLASGAQVGWNITSRTDSGAYQTFGVNGHAGETTLAAASVGLQLRRKGADGTDGTGMFSRVRVAATTNIAIATALENGDMVDGVVLVTGDLVLLTGQTAPAENGVYVVPASGAAARDGSFDTYNEHPGVYFSVMEGTTKADTLWRCTSNKGGTLGTTAIVISEFTAGLAAFTVASASGAAALAFHEDTDNGTNKVTVQGPASVAFDKVIVLPDAAGTMGSAIFQNTGTSGGNVPLLNANNIASGTWDFQQTGSFAVPVTLTSSNADDVQGPVLKLLRNSGTLAVNDVQGAVLFQSRDDGGGFPISATMYVNTLDISAASYDAEYVFQVAVASSPTNAARFGNGMQVGTPTGGYKGFGSINASDVYNDNVALTCMACAEEFLATGSVDLDKWDAMVPDVIEPAKKKLVPVVVETDHDEIVFRRDEDGSMVATKTGRKERVQLKDWTPIYDQDGNGIDAVVEEVFDTIEIEAKVVTRRHGTAHLFAAMLAEGFDPRDPAAYIAKLKSDEALPGMPSRTSWAHNAVGSGELFMRLWLATEMLALVVMNHEERLALLEA